MWRCEWSLGFQFFGRLVWLLFVIEMSVLWVSTQSTFLGESPVSYRFCRAGGIVGCLEELSGIIGSFDLWFHVSLWSFISNTFSNYSIDVISHSWSSCSGVLPSFWAWFFLYACVFFLNGSRHFCFKEINWSSQLWVRHPSGMKAIIFLTSLSLRSHPSWSL